MKSLAYSNARFSIIKNNQGARDDGVEKMKKKNGDNVNKKKRGRDGAKTKPPSTKIFSVAR